jgi:hypothetical protein
MPRRLERGRREETRAAGMSDDVRRRAAAGLQGFSSQVETRDIDLPCVKNLTLLDRVAGGTYWGRPAGTQQCTTQLHLPLHFFNLTLPGDPAVHWYYSHYQNLIVLWRVVSLVCSSFRYPQGRRLSGNSIESVTVCWSGSVRSSLA